MGLEDLEVKDAEEVQSLEAFIQAKVDELKKKHSINEIFVIQADDKLAFVKRPSRAQLAYAMTLAQSNPLGMAEEILKSGWLDGDEELQTDDKYFLSISSQIDAIIETTDVAIKKY